MHKNWSNHGLTKPQLDTIKRILKPYAKEIDRVGLFGSRASGAYRENSDIDLVIYGPLSKEIADRLWTLFDESNLSVKVDVNVYQWISYQPLKDHVDAEVCPLFLKEDFLD